HGNRGLIVQRVAGRLEHADRDDVTEAVEHQAHLDLGIPVFLNLGIALVKFEISTDLLAPGRRQPRSAPSRSSVLLPGVFSIHSASPPDQDRRSRSACPWANRSA